MDLPPVLIALGARITIAGKTGERTLPVEKLYAGYYETVLKRDELIAAVTIPPQGARRSVYMKVTTRAVHDWPALGVAVSVDADGGSVREATVVVSAATETPRRLPGAEQVLRGGTASESLFRQAGEAASSESELLTDHQGSAAYKSELLRVYVRRALMAAMNGGGR
jgi:carbon-monoxide dehydrogenase medium subunit